MSVHLSTITRYSGNRSGSGYALAPGGGNQLAAGDGYTSIAYEAEGNLISKVAGATITTYAYDHRDRLVGSTAGTYTYDALDRRVAANLNGAITWAVWDGDQPYADLTDAGAVQTRFLQGDAEDAALAATDANGTTRWYLGDRQGSVRDLATAAGADAGHLAYDAFGDITAISAALTSAPAFALDGMRLETQTNLYYDRAGFYSPNTGRFLNEDPSGFAGGDANLYRFVGNGPQDGTDPSGLAAGQEPGRSTFDEILFRLGGLAQAAVGALEVAAAAPLFAAPEPVLTKVAGGALGLHGCDNINTGLIRKAILGQDARTATAQVAEAGLAPIDGVLGEGYARPLADGIDMGIPLVGPLAAGATKASELFAARLAAERAALAAEEAAVNARLAELLQAPGQRVAGQVRTLSQVEQGQGRNLETIRNLIRDHAKEHSDFSGVAGERLGCKYPKPEGGYYNHIGEMEQSVKDLKKLVSRLQESLKATHPPEVRGYIEKQIGSTQAMIDRMGRALTE